MRWLSCFNVYRNGVVLVIAITLFHNQLFGQAEVIVVAGTQTCIGSPVTFHLRENQPGANPVAKDWTVRGSNYVIQSGGGTANFIRIIWNSPQSNAGVTVNYSAYGGNYHGPASEVVNITGPTKTATVSVSADRDIVCENEPINFSTSTNSTSTYYKWFVDGRFYAGGDLPYYSMQELSPGSHTVYVTMMSTECVTNPEFTAISAPITVLVKPIVQRPSTPVGPDTYCIGSGMNTTYTTSAIGAESFNWTLYPAGAGNISVVAHGKALIDWNDSYANQTVLIRVSGNGCSGPSSINSKPVQMSNRLQTPSVPVGRTRRCQGNNSDDYSSSAGNAETYSWRIEPSSAGSVSSNTKIVNGNLISEATVNWNPLHYGQARIIVRAAGCGEELLESYTTVHTIETASTPFPGVPVSPNGLMARCQGAGSTLYATSAVNADEYRWSISPSSAGEIDNSKASSISVTWSSLFSGTARISVTAINCRGESEPSAVEVNVTPLVTAVSVPDGPSFNIIGSTSKYSVTAEFAESFAWSIYPAIAGSVGSDGTVHWSDRYAGQAEVRVRAKGCNGSGANSVRRVQVYDRSFFRETTVLIPGQTAPSQVEDLGAFGKNTVTKYYDGLGRPDQVVSQAASPSRKDIVETIEYDEFGRESVAYLPYVAGEDDGSYKVNLKGKAEGGYLNSRHFQFYNDPSDNIARSEYPFAVTVYAPSPLNRVFKIGAPGIIWQPDDDLDSFDDKTHKKRYDTNGANEVYMFTYDEETSAVDLHAPPTCYPAGKLYKRKTYDENHNEMIEYVDMFERIICTKRHHSTELNGARLYAETYYIYDVFGHLVVVLPPEAIHRIKTNFGLN